MAAIVAADTLRTRFMSCGRAGGRAGGRARPGSTTGRARGMHRSVRDADLLAPCTRSSWAAARGRLHHLAIPLQNRMFSPLFILCPSVISSQKFLDDVLKGSSGPSGCVAGADVGGVDGRGRAAVGDRGRRVLVPAASPAAAAAPPDGREFRGSSAPLLPDGGVRVADGRRRRCRRRRHGPAAPQLCDTRQDLLKSA